MHPIFTIIPNFLRQPTEFFESLSRGEAMGAKASALSFSAILFLAIFGFVTGLSHSPWQALAGAVKMPVLFVATVFFCLPAFYFFSLVLGTKLSLPQVATVVLAAIGVIAFLLLGLAPVTLFFVLTSNNYAFFRLLATLFVAVSGCIGMWFLWRGMTFLDTRTNDGARNLRRPLLGLWVALYAFMGSQMTWRLSPFVSDPTQPFVLLLPSRDNFYVDVLNALIELLGVPLPPVNASAFLIGAACLFPLIILLFGFGMLRDRKSKPAHQDAPTVQVLKT